MTLIKNIAPFLTVMIMAAGCSQLSDEQQLAAFINNPRNKIKQTIAVGNMKLTAKWLPYYGQSVHEGGAVADAPQQYDYFNVKLEHIVTTLEKPDKNKTMHLDFNMQQDFMLVQNADTLLPAICQKVAQGRDGCYEYLLAFETNASQPGRHDYTLLYNDILFGIGQVAFVYKKEDTQKIPVIKSLAAR